MKFLKSFFITGLIVLATSCNLDLLDDPNAVKLSQTDPSLLLNNVQVGMASFFNRASTFGMQMTRLQNSGGSIYENFANPQAYDAIWADAYSTVLEDCDVLIKRAEENNYTVHAGMARILQAYTLTTLVDYFGNVPFSEALQKTNSLNPSVDRMEDLYPSIIAMLDKAIVDLRTTPNAVAPLITDFFYGGNTTRWIRLANSLKLKMYLNLRLTDAAGATAGISAALADAAGVMSAQSDSFVFRYATNNADPDVRHPRFTGNYITGAGDYMANYLMWQMFYGYDRHTGTAPSQGDPRMRFYFYRQRSGNSSDPNEIRCVAQTAPGHYPFSTGTAIIYGKPGVPPGISTNAASPAWTRTFCFPTPIGYWGREHVDPQGIPPDGLARTTWGPYPAGGRFDANVNAGVNNPALGMRGAGMQPILMRSSVNFMRAEAALFLGVGGVADAQFSLGVTNSLTDVRDWSVNGTLGTSTFASSPTESGTINTFYPAAAYTADAAAYAASALAAYNAQADNNGRLDYIAREYWISLFGSGVEAYNLYRRTGLPNGMQPTVNPAPGAFPRSFWYPSSFEARNSQVDQKANLTGKIFWDITSTNLDF
jgi:hypothetical protein